MFTLINTVERITALIGRDDLDGLAWDLAAKAIDATLEADESTGIDAARAIESVANFVDGIEDLTPEEEAEAHEAVAAGIRMIEKLRAAPRGIVLVNADSGYVYGLGTDISAAQREIYATVGREHSWEQVDGIDDPVLAGPYVGRYRAYSIPLLAWSAEDGDKIRAIGEFAGYWLARDVLDHAVFEDKLKSGAAIIEATDWNAQDVKIEVFEDGTNDCYNAVVWLSSDMQQRLGIDGGIEVKGSPLGHSVEFSLLSGEDLSAARDPSSPDEQELTWWHLRYNPVSSVMDLVRVALESHAGDLEHDEAWFEFAVDGPYDQVYGWGTRAEAAEYLDFVNADDERRYAMYRVTEAERVRLGLDQQCDEVFNLSDVLIGLRAAA